MLVRNISELPALLRKNACLIGLDYGSVVIGVAVSDPGLVIASPIASITRKKFDQDAATLAALIKERDAGGIIIGLPKNMDGTESGSAQAARAFIRNLSDKGFLPPGFPILFWDERLSTAAVERFLIEDNMTRKRRDQVVDKAAAAYILQGALDALKHQPIR